MFLRRLYERFKNQVLRQEIEGTYVKRRSADNKAVLACIGLASVLAGLITLGIFLGQGSVMVHYSDDFERPVYLRKGRQYMYVEIDQLFQNSLAYSKSINYDQLDGQTEDLNLTDCAPYDYKDGIPFYPAGVIANTYFQDVIELDGLEIKETGIAWGSESKLIGMTDYKPGEFLPPENWSQDTNRGSVALNTRPGSGLPILNERFVNWMYLSMLSRFRKLWGIIDVPESGEYKLKVKSAFDFSKKHIYFSEQSWLGMKNYWLSAGLIILGGFAILSALLFKMFDAE